MRKLKNKPNKNRSKKLGERLDVDLFSVFKVILKYGTTATLASFLTFASLQSGSYSDSKEVIAFKNDEVNVKLSRRDIKSYLEECERNAILNMTDLSIMDKFYDVELTDKDWDNINKSYQEYIANNYESDEYYETVKEVYKVSEEFAKLCIKVEYKKEKMIDEMISEASVTSEDIDYEWQTNKISYQYVRGELAVFRNENEAKKFYEGVTSGDMKYSDISEGIAQVSEDEKVYYLDDRLLTKIENTEVGQILYLYTSDGYGAVLRVNEVFDQKQQLKGDIVKYLKESKCRSSLNYSYDEYYNSLSVSIDGESITEDD